MTHICKECTGRAGEILHFRVYSGGDRYDHTVSCPVCGQHHTVVPRHEYLEEIDR